MSQDEETIIPSAVLLQLAGLLVKDLAALLQGEHADGLTPHHFGSVLNAEILEIIDSFYCDDERHLPQIKAQITAGLSGEIALPKEKEECQILRLIDVERVH